MKKQINENEGLIISDVIKSALKFRTWIASQDYMAIQGTPDLETLQSFMFHYGDEKNIMQFTGLKDKNGIEIYQGDIFTCDRVNYILRFLTIGGAYTVHKIIDEIDERFLFHCNDQIEIIGNIYQNPELLQQTS